ncbi:uncharacterized protein DUF3331 [Paraburkholderia sp. BL27I4N3]|uniref:DUF3331 domain-containing protein n=1 Tax=Paraburkholderia sp. BL27I4N3 TaxID=1938805 RepID=UPI000E379333|nr:DUF3331 domain-containing protein [Paraburkholderia sp. BL27I4N3]REE18096.1 uncharacterized protein DUF3331 [Paraburkholderia sp. BL27I4N3]
MDQYVTDNIAWQRTVGQLDAGCADQFADHVKGIVSSQGSKRVSNINRSVSVALLDRISPRTATVSWSDPQGCKYGEQVWRLAAAKRSGICALSGQPIATGDTIYRPTKVDPPPANAAAMMLAIAIDRAFADRCCTLKEDGESASLDEFGQFASQTHAYERAE